LVHAGFRMVVAEGKAAAVAAIEKEIRAAAQIVVATDAGRQGEMIAWEMIDRAGSSVPVRRFWSSALTDSALRKAVAELLPAERKLPLYHGGRARSRRLDRRADLHPIFHPDPHRTEGQAPQCRPHAIGRDRTYRGPLP